MLHSENLICCMSIQTLSCEEELDNYSPHNVASKIIVALDWK